ncbi:MAG: hypothetical protein ACK42Y_07310 [Candidatus Thermochlorobacter sp.]
MRTTLFLLSGDAKTILTAHALPEDTIVQPFSERELTQPLMVRKRFLETKGRLFFGTKVLHLQRYRLILKLLLFLSGKSRAAILDEAGKRENYSLLRFIFVDIWKLLVEIIASAFIVLKTYLELESLQRAKKA